MSIKFLILGGGFGGGGGECRFYFYGRADFSEYRHFGVSDKKLGGFPCAFAEIARAHSLRDWYFGCFFFFGGGGEVPILFLWARGFFLV